MSSNFEIFQKNLYSFIDKYYLNRFKRGVLLVLILIGLIFLTISFIEYYAWTSSRFRLFLFLFCLLSISFIVYYFLFIPILRFFKVLPRVTNRDAALLLTQYFPESKDLFISILELRTLDINLKENKDLIQASIEQKSNLAQNYNFSRAISNKNLKPLFKYLAGVFLIIVYLVLFNQEIIVESSNRIFHFQQEFEKNVGFTVDISNDDLTVEKGKSKIVTVNIIGDTYPEELFLVINGNEFLLIKKDKRVYTFEFKNVLNPFYFRIANSYYKSKEFYLNIISPPVINSYILDISFPGYLDLKNTSVNDKLSFNVANGSLIDWNIKTSNIDTLFFVSTQTIDTIISNSNEFSFSKTISQDFDYNIYGSNGYLKKELFSNNLIKVVPDLFPTIKIENSLDENNLNTLLFQGLIEDDYGFNRLIFNCNNGIKDTSVVIPINTNIQQQEFFFLFDFESFEGKRFASFFTVFDNDEVNGYKSTNSDFVNFDLPSFEEIQKQLETKNIEIEKSFEKALFLTKDLTNEMEDIKKRLISDKLEQSEREKLVADLVEKQNNLNRALEELAKKNESKNQYSNTHREKNEELLEKQKRIEELLNSLMTDEIKALLKELEELKKEFNQNEFNKLSHDLEKNYENLEKKLDQNLELLKRMEVEAKMYDIIEQLNIISENQDKLLSELHIEKPIDTLKILNNQDIKLAKQVTDKFEKALEQNKDLESPYNMDIDKKEFNELNESIQNNFSDSTQSKNNQEKNIEKSRDDAKKLADQLGSMMKSNNANEVGEDIDRIRQILENLLYFSFTQESLNLEFGGISRTNPLFEQALSQQNDLGDIFIIIRDSLDALNKRSPVVGNHISDKVFTLERKLSDLKNYSDSEGLERFYVNQRNVIQLSNDLVLLLAESLKNAENSFGSGGESKNKKNKSKPGKQSLGDLRKSQEGLKSQLESMIEQLKKGGGKNGSLSNEQLGKMLAEQEVFQQMLNELANSSSVGKESAKKLNEINKLLEDNKRDIIRNNINPQTLNRQNQIVTKMLEAEKAEQEREIDDIRKSKEAINITNEFPKLKFEQNNQIINFEEPYSKSGIQLNPFYKNKYQEYLNKLNQQLDGKRN